MENVHLKESIMFYNVENLFQPDPPPNHHLDPPPSGLRGWNNYRYENKLHKLSYVFELIQEKYGKMPLIVGVSEVQGKKVIQDLLKNHVFWNYDFIHYESMDERGVDVALLYDKTKIEVLHSEPISYFFKIDNGNPNAFDTTRDVLFCKLKFNDIIFNVFVLHLPSKREHDVNKPKREYILKELGERISEIVVNSDEVVIVCGDFNENPDNDIVKHITIDKNFNTILTNPYLNLYMNGVYSTFHNKSGLLFDQIMLSGQFFNQNSSLQFKKATVFNVEKLSSWDRIFKNRPFRTYAGTRYLGGYSDHYPVLVEIEIIK